jgi:phospholipid/cholesterol/gamma-HCH transport system ATP-binding protein
MEYMRINSTLMNERITLRNIHKSFGEKKVLRGVDLDVYNGETLCIIGRSGTGKSVILRHLIGLLEPDEGSIYIDGERSDHADKNTRARFNSLFGVLFQGAALFDSMNIYDNISFGPRRKAMNEGDIRELVSPLIQKLGLNGFENKMPHELSGGLQKRVGLARALAMNPQIMLYDEPTTGVDPITASSVNAMIADNAKDSGITSVVITHDMKSVQTVADRVVMLHEGHVAFSGTPVELAATQDPMLRQFIEGTSDD